MKYQKVGDNYLVIIRRGDRIVESLIEVCQKEKLVNASFVGIGAVDQVEIAHYSVGGKKFSSFKLEEPLEMVSLIGNVFPDQKTEELIVHAHASFGRPTGELVGGHLVEGRISGVGEISLTPFPSLLSKSYDEETGLKVVDW